MASSPQFWGWLENRGGKDDEILRRVWKVVETKAEEIRVVKVKEEREKKEEEKKEKEKKKPKNKKTIEVKKVTKE